MARTLGLFVLVATAIFALGAPMLAPHAADQQFGSLLNAPPTIVRLQHDGGEWGAPFIYPWVLVNQLEQRYEEDRTAPTPLTWLQADSFDRRTRLALRCSCSALTVTGATFSAGSSSGLASHWACLCSPRLVRC